MKELHTMTREERKRRGEAGRQYALGPGQFTADRMSELFIQDMDTALEKWTPRTRFEMVKA
jgi:hypothetical protein